MKEIAKEKARKKPQEIDCPHCASHVTTKVRRQCTCITVLKWMAMFFFFCFCILCICIYTPVSRGGAVQDYLECKWLHRSIVHYCPNCQRKVMIKHPKLGFSDSSDEESGSSGGSEECSSEDD